MREILDNRFTHHLASPVWAVRLESSRFRNWYFRGVAVYGCGGRIDNAGAVELRHDLEEVYCSGDIVVVVCHWNLGRLAHCLVRLNNWRRNQEAQKSQHASLDK